MLKKLSVITLLLFGVWVLAMFVSCGCETQPVITADMSGTETPNTTQERPTDTTVTTKNPTGSTTESTTPFEPERVKPEEVILNKVRVQLLSDTLVRMEVAMSGGKFQDQASYSVINRDDWYKVD